MEAIILAGGFGTRLKEVVSDIPKPMAPVNNRPFLELILDELNDQGFKHIVLSVGYKHEIIMNHFKHSYKNMKISYKIEETPLGTGGAILYALDLINDEYFYIINGDTLFKIDYNLLNQSSPITIAAKYLNHTDRYGRLMINSEGYVTSFMEKENDVEGFINGGIYRVSKQFFKSLNLVQKFSFEKDILEKQVDKMNIKAVVYNDYFIDMGIPKDYQKLKEDLLNE